MKKAIAILIAFTSLFCKQSNAQSGNVFSQSTAAGLKAESAYSYNTNKIAILGDPSTSFGWGWYKLIYDNGTEVPDENRKFRSTFDGDFYWQRIVAPIYSGGTGSTNGSILAITGPAVSSGADQVSVYFADDPSGVARMWLRDENNAVTNILSGVIYDSTTATPHVRLLNPVWTGSTAGNTRGAGAVDLQVGRNAATKVASGANSFTAGTNCTASGTYTTATGNGSVASGNTSVAMGRLTTASQTGAVAIGDLGTASAASSLALNYDTTASASYATAINYKTTAEAIGSLSQGFYSKTRLIYSHSQAGGIFSALGDAQTTTVVARRTTSGATPATLLLDGSAATINLPANTSWKYTIDIVARTTDAGTGDEESAAYEVRGLIERDNAAANTRLVGVPVYTVLAEDDAAWTVAVSADTTNGALTITVTGNDETLVHWLARIELVEVGG